LSGKTSVVYFYGADDAPSCKKENSLFDEKVAEFKAAGATVVGVRNEAGAKGADVSQSLVVDEDDAIRNKISISKDLFGLLGGRETYVLNKKGEVEFVFNNQFKPEDHVTKTLSKVQEMKESAPAGFDLASFFAQK
jgi:peroxiredoxin Q/BCP